MPVRNTVMRALVQQLVHTAWRRKVAVLMSLFLLGSVILLAQSYSANGPPPPGAPLEYAVKTGNVDMGSPLGAQGVPVKPRIVDAPPPVRQLDRNNYNAMDNSKVYHGMVADEGSNVQMRPRMGLESHFVQGDNTRSGNNNNGGGSSREGITGARTGGFIPKERLVHFDLKGAHPKVSYFKQVFTLIKAAGATGVLLEWEDTFPYEGRLKRLHTSNGYNKENIREILRYAKENDLWVMPLIQTFGHLEFVLKLKEFRHLRENDEHSMALCPSQNASFELVKEMIDQMMALHPDVKYVHIGSDEVFHMGECRLCQSRDRDDIFLSHVTRVAKYVKEKYHVQPVMWDDMLRQIVPERIKKSGLQQYAEPMVWSYVKDLYHFVSHGQWQSFADTFDSAWAASAFKGAFGETLIVPNAKMHLENNEAWLEVMNDQSGKFKQFRGIVITGWQRYDHMAVLCELFPSAFPSLTLNLLAVSNGGWSEKLERRFNEIMQCTNPSASVDLRSDNHLFNRAYGCRFPGWQVFSMTQNHAESIKRTRQYLDDVTLSKAWLTEYNFRHNYSLNYRIDQGLEEFPQVMYGLTSLTTQARDALKIVFDDYTTAEWIEQNIYPWILKMDRLKNNSAAMRSLRVWEPRPLKMNKALERFGLRDPAAL